MLHTDIQITGDDFRDAFKREQEALRVARDARLRNLAIDLGTARHDLMVEYAATYECAREDGEGEADSAELAGQVAAERLFWLWENVVSDTRKPSSAEYQRACAEYLESALEAITESVHGIDHERANVIQAAAHVELYRLHDIDLPAHAKARVAAIRERLAATKGAA